jgi:hypothetical protein
MTSTFYVFHALNHTGQRFDERGVAEIRFRLEPQQVFLDEWRGNDNGFSVSAVEEQQIFAKIFLFVAAKKTFAAGRGIGRDDAVADLPVGRVRHSVRAADGIRAGGGQGTARPTLRNFRDDAGEFVAEDGGRHDHSGMIAAFENLQVGAAGERGLNADADFARFQRRRRKVLDLNVFFTVKNGGFHGRSIRPRTIGAEEKFL